MKNKVICSMAFDFDCKFNFSKILVDFNGFELVFHNGGEEHYDIVECLLSSWSDVDSFMQTAFEFCLSITSYHNFCSFHYVSDFIVGGVDDEFKIFENKPRQQQPRNPSHFTADLYRVKNLATEEQKLVSAIWNDAQNTHNPFFKFLCYWKIFEIPIGGKSFMAEDWINNTIIKNPKVIEPSNRLQKMQKDGKNIGKYFKDNYRNAIAHISKPPNLSSHKHLDYRNVSIANYDLSLFAEYFLKNEITWEKDNIKTKILETK